MPQNHSANYAVLDQPQVLAHLFHPRLQMGARSCNPDREDMMIPVESSVGVGASLHRADTGAPTILFFHGNGEIVADYDDLGQLFSRIGINFFVADYRGYGVSTGQPSVSAMMQDCHTIFEFVRNYIRTQGMTGPLCIMGRSLGSASAIELAASHQDRIHSLIVESGFAWAGPLLRTLGIDTDRLGFKEEQGFENIHKIEQFSKPCLVIHAQYDHIIPFGDGQALYDACGASDKKLLEIKNANHNDIFLRGMETYLSHVRDFSFDRV
jgi:alpha-beta hydrolase superfamily lysophospholipase